MTEGQFSDLMQRVTRLERQRTAKPASPPAQTREKTVWFPNEVVLVEDYTRTLTTGTDWIDSGSGRWVPNNAVGVIVFAGIGDTESGTGETEILARAAGVVSPISRIWEDSGSASASGFCQRTIPTVGGRFDYKINLAPSANYVTYKISLLGYLVNE